MEKYSVDVVIVGAGVIGLSVARALALQGRSVWILDKEGSFGYGTSSRNSEVIHAGIYYPQESRKARLCVEGKALLYQYCKERSIAYSQCGKLIVATNSAQEAKLHSIKRHAEQNGVLDVELLSRDATLSREPALNAVASILSPSTGIVDSHALMQSLLADAENAGAHFVPATNVRVLECSPDCFVLSLGEDEAQLTASTLINASGLYAPYLLKGVAGFPQAMLPTPRYARGSYFSYSGRAPFKHLIYPVPEEGGLGVHLTLDLSGSARFGPDVDWVDISEAAELDAFDYKVDEQKKAAFFERVSQYWPGVELERLQPAYSGLRPKILSVDGLSNSAQDFYIQSDDVHGLAGLVNLFGIESPGLTSCLAIGKQVASLV